MAVEREGRPEGEAGLRIVLVALLFACACVFLWPATTGDMRNFLIPWLDTILERGQMGAFAHPFSNYTPPYLYLLAAISPLVTVLPKISVIKLLSLLGTGPLGFAAHRLLRSLGSRRPIEGSLWLMVLPTVVTNAAGMGQADAFWTAACVMAVACAVERRSVPMLVWFGVAVSLKAQAVFLAPFIGHYLIQQKVRLTLWPIPFAVYALAMAPAALAGWPVFDLLTVYLRQAQWNAAFIGNAANPWSLVQYAAPHAGTAWLWTGDLAALGAAVLLTLGSRCEGEASARRLLGIALLSAIVIPFLLPKMHERFFFLADVLAFLLAWSSRDRRLIAVAALVQGSSIASLAGLLLRQPLFPIMGAAMVTLAIPLLFVELSRKPIRPRIQFRKQLAAHDILPAS